MTESEIAEKAFIYSWDTAISKSEARAYSTCTTWRRVYKDKDGVPQIELLPNLELLSHRRSRDGITVE